MCALSAMHKSQMFLLSAGPCAVNMLEHGDENQTTTNKCFLLPTAAILEQITKRTFFGTLDSGRPKTCALVFRTFLQFFFPLCLSFSLHIRLMREVFFFFFCCCCIACVVSRSLSECSFGRVTESSLRAKQTAVAYG